tara:strand:- start:1771 stop:2724 length:954 start_codon:yes stop_codon:yes gene_type:complete
MFLFLFLLVSPINGFNHQDCSKYQDEVVSGKHGIMCDYMKRFNKKYIHQDEFLDRKQTVFNRIYHHKRTSKTVKFGLNSFSDRKFYKNMHLKRKSPIDGHHKLMLSSYHLPDELDLREKMQPIKDQGQCGSCYTFAAASVLEYHAGTSISEQKLMDCTSSTNGPSYGCGGGWPETLFEYAMKSTIVSEEDQPYTAENHACNQTCSESVVDIESFGIIDMEKDENSESRIPYILNTHGPVVVAIDVGTTELLMSYMDGIFPSIACGMEPDHAVTIVGYTEDYWIVRNSWGNDWGDDGYFYLERGVNACGVAGVIGYVV